MLPRSDVAEACWTAFGAAVLGTLLYLLLNLNAGCVASLGG